MLRVALLTARVLARFVGYGALGAAATALVVFVVYVDSKPDLSIWHTTDLDGEYSAESDIEHFDDYLALEEHLFRELDERIYARVGDRPGSVLERYHRGSLADPERWPRNWNRSYELEVEAPRAGAVLIHGMSDSPYSLRAMAERLHGASVHVLGLRVPGHGTIPSGLTRVRWQDMAEAVRLATRHLRDEIGDAPLFLVGYSNGGALAVHHVLAASTDPDPARVDRLVLISPEIGVTPLAALAIWQERIGRLLGLEKLAWTSVLPEYDPFKYQSFAANAGDQAYRLTREIARLMSARAADGGLEAFPPVLAFQSAVDATVSTPAVIEGLIGRLPPGDHELVLFDLNRWTDIEILLRNDPAEHLRALLDVPDPAYTLRVVTNASESTREVVERTRPAGQRALTTRALDLRWPAGVFSLSHVALPFAPTDPLYGDHRALPSPGIAIGRVTLRGERGVLDVPAAEMLRQRSNAFYPYLEERALSFLGLEATSDGDDPTAAVHP